MAAAAGETFRPDVLAAACGSPEAELLAALDEAVRARLARAAEPGWFAFGHALIRDALYDRLTIPQRADVHRRIGDALERAPSAEPPCAELAHHFRRAGDARCSTYAELAGRRSAERLAYEDAAAHFATALATIGESEDDRRGRLLIALGESRLGAGDVPRAREAFEDAAALARRTQRPELLARAALGFSAGLGGFEVRMFDRAQIDLLEEALAALGLSDSALRAWSMAMLSVALTYVEPSGRRAELADDAVAMARRTGDDRALSHALSAWCDAYAGPDATEERLAHATEIVRLARRSGDLGMELLGRRHRIVAQLELGDIPSADAEIGAYEAAARALRQPVYASYVPIWRAMRALMDGRIAEARELKDEAGEIGARGGSANAALLAEMVHHQAFAEEGREAEAAEAMRAEIEHVDGIWGEPVWVALFAPSVHPEAARAALDRVVAGDLEEFPRDAQWLSCLCAYLANACTALRAAGPAAKIYELLLPYASRFSLEGIGAVCHGSVSRRLGALAAVLGRYDQAAAHYEDALAAHRRAGAAGLVAHTLRDYGAMLAEAGERARAEPLLREALETYRSLGMDVRAAQVESLAGTAPAGEAVFRREGDSWTLVYAGRTARERHTKGLGDIATLLSKPGREVHVADLIATTAVPTAPDDPVLDHRARAAYRRRLEELRDELDDAERFSDAVRAERARAEMDALAGELAAALGLGGRARQISNPAERARKAVAQRVRNALRRMERDHPELARHLERSLRMGSFCSYEPERAIDWML